MAISRHQSPCSLHLLIAYDYPLNEWSFRVAHKPHGGGPNRARNEPTRQWRGNRLVRALDQLRTRSNLRPFDPQLDSRGAKTNQRLRHEVGPDQRINSDFLLSLETI